MSNIQLAKQKTYSIVPTTFEELERYADRIAKSSICPSSFKEKAGDVLVAMQMGAEIGLSPIQALQNIAVINGKPSIYGDAAIALVRSSPNCEYIKEWMEGDVKSGNAIAYCKVKRRNQEEEIRSFSIAQASRAGLWEKSGPWKLYPERMLQMRARGFALRDVFADILKGLNIAEEVMDIPTAQYKVISSTNVTNNFTGVDKLKSTLGINHNNDTRYDPEDSSPVPEDEFIPCNETEEVINASSVIEDLKKKLEECKNMQELKSVVIPEELSEKDKNELRDVYKRVRTEILGV